MRIKSKEKERETMKNESRERNIKSKGLLNIAFTEDSVNKLFRPELQTFSAVYEMIQGRIRGGT